MLYIIVPHCVHNIMIDELIKILFFKKYNELIINDHFNMDINYINIKNIN